MYRLRSTRNIHIAALLTVVTLVAVLTPGSTAAQGVVGRAIGKVLNVLPRDADEFAGVYGRAARAAEMSEMARASKAMERRSAKRTGAVVVGFGATAEYAHLTSRTALLDELKAARNELLIVVGHNDGGRLRLASGEDVALSDLTTIAGERNNLVVAVSCEARAYITAPHAATTRVLSPGEAADIASEFADYLWRRQNILAASAKGPARESDLIDPDFPDFADDLYRLPTREPRGTPAERVARSRRTLAIGVFWARFGETDGEVVRDVQEILQKVEDEVQLRARVTLMGKRASVPLAGAAVVVVAIRRTSPSDSVKLEIVDQDGRLLARTTKSRLIPVLTRDEQSAVNRRAAYIERERESKREAWQRRLEQRRRDRERQRPSLGRTAPPSPPVRP